MYILDNVPLNAYTTMRLGGVAAHLAEINDRSQLTEALAWAEARQLPVIMIGGGSNTFWSDAGFPGLVLVNKILRYETFNEDQDNLYVTAGAGEVWDSVVEKTVAGGYSGIECLSLIPGSVGAAPIQNIGAYGQELSNALVSVEAYDTHTKQFTTIPTADCAFGYRTSRFKTTDKGRFFVTAVTLHVTRMNPMPPFYDALQAYFEKYYIREFTPKVVRDAVIAIRKDRLPDPAVVANNGSFFTNPVVSRDTFEDLRVDYPQITFWNTDDERVKLAAAWLLEQTGFKDMHDAETGMATWPKQPLVLVNEHAQRTADLLKFKQKIIDAVQTKFGITLEQEPEQLGQ